MISIYFAISSVICAIISLWFAQRIAFKYNHRTIAIVLALIAISSFLSSTDKIFTRVGVFYN